LTTNINVDVEGIDMSDFLKQASVVKNASWFDGSSDSIYYRIDQLQDLINGLKTAASDVRSNDSEIEKYASYIIEMDAEKEVLQKVASEYVDFDTEEYLQSLPGGVVAAQYRKYSGRINLGYDDGSLEWRIAKETQEDIDNVDWINFVTAGAENWVIDQNPSLLNDQSATREAASYYVEDVTMPILDITHRASVVDNFLDNVELTRRERHEANLKKADKMSKQASVASSFITKSYDDTFDSTGVNWL
jgi:hypothetical protein